MREQLSKLLITGSGSRETAICRSLATASPAPQLLIAPGNPGTASFGRNVAIAADDCEALAKLAVREGIELVVPGDSRSLALGLADLLAERGIACAGPCANAAALGADRIFARTVAESAGIPLPHFVISRREAELAWAIDAWEGVPLIKTSTPGAAGVFAPADKNDCLACCRRLRAQHQGGSFELILEQRIEGTLASLFYACDGDMILPMPDALVHYGLGGGETRPEEPGMAAESPHPRLTPDLTQRMIAEVARPLLVELRRRGILYRGFLATRVIFTNDGPKLFDVDVTLGDPEAQAILPRLAKGGFLSLCTALAHGELAKTRLVTEHSTACAVVLAASGYPEAPDTGAPVDIDPEVLAAGRWLDLGETQLDGDHVVTAGGRVASVVARADKPEAAAALAHEGVGYIGFSGMQFRHDIGGSLE